MKPEREVGYLDVFTTWERYAFKWARFLHLRALFYRWYQKSLSSDPELACYRDIHRGERCIIMGNGPSLKLVNPDLLRDEITFGVNGIFLLYDWLKFEPTYYVVEDFLVFDDRAGDISNKVNQSTCFFPKQFKKPDFDRSNHNYFRALYEFDPRAGFPSFSTDVSKLLWIGGTVTYACLQLAYYMGFEEVYLVGMDHNYEKPDHVKTEGNVWLSQGDDPNHFHPDYFGAGYRWHDPMVWRMEIAYEKAREVFESNGRQIYNATEGGYLEVLERVKFGEVFA